MAAALTSTEVSAVSALRGVTVLERAGFVVGPYCGRLLAELGAEVLKSEPPAGDEARGQGPFQETGPDPETSALFLYLNAGKRSVTLNSDIPTGSTLLRRLAAMADVLITDAPPGSPEAESVAGIGEANPSLIVMSITPFGQTGPYAGYQARDLGAFASGGEAYTLPGSLSHELFPDGPPIRAGGYLADHDAGLTAAVAIVSALLGRVATGAGGALDLSRQEAAMGMARETLQRLPGYGEVVDRARSYFFGGIFPCRDGHVILMPRENRHWQSLCEAMGQPSLAVDPRFREFDGRREHREALGGILRAWARDLPMDRIYHEAAGRGCPAAPFYDSANVAASAQLAARSFFSEVEHPKAGRLRHPTAAYRMSGEVPRPRGPAPLLGQDNEDIYCGRLGLSPGELTSLRRAGVV